MPSVNRHLKLVSHIDTPDVYISMKSWHTDGQWFFNKFLPLYHQSIYFFNPHCFLFYSREPRTASRYLLFSAISNQLQARICSRDHWLDSRALDTKTVAARHSFFLQLIGQFCSRPNATIAARIAVLLMAISSWPQSASNRPPIPHLPTTGPLGLFSIVGAQIASMLIWPCEQSLLSNINLIPWWPKRTPFGFKRVPPKSNIFQVTRVAVRRFSTIHFLDQDYLVMTLYTTNWSVAFQMKAI